LSFSNSSQKIAEKGMLPNLFYEASITLIPKPDEFTTQKRKLQANIPDDQRSKNPQQNFSKPNSIIHEKEHSRDARLVQGCMKGFSICKSINT